MVQRRSGRGVEEGGKGMGARGGVGLGEDR